MLEIQKITTPDVPTPTQELSPVYETCEELPLYNYIRCLVYNDKAHLLHDYNKREAALRIEELNRLWARLEGEYMELIEDSIDAHALSLFYERESLIILNVAIKHCTEMMATYRGVGFEKILRKEGFDFKFDPNDSEGYENDLKRVFKRQKKIVFDIEEAEKKLQMTKKDIKITVPFFDNILTNLSKFMGCHVDEKQISVSRYASILNAYTNYVEQLKTQSHARI